MRAQSFFEVTRKELNNMVTWNDGAPVAEFWEMFDRAEDQIRAQAAQAEALEQAVNEAQELIQYLTYSFYSHLHDEGQIVNEYDVPGSDTFYWDSIKQARAWLAAHPATPAPEQEGEK